jgi:hypothetical protein
VEKTAMRTYLHLLLGAGAVLLIVAGVRWHNSGSPPAGEAEPENHRTDPWAELLRLPDLLRTIDQNRAREDRLAAELAAAQDQVRVRREIIIDLLAGRISLPEGVRRFRESDETSPYFDRSDFRRSFPGATDAERHCRKMIEFVRNQAAFLPVEAQGMADRLEAELPRHPDPEDRPAR